MGTPGSLPARPQRALRYLAGVDEIVILVCLLCRGVLASRCVRGWHSFPLSLALHVFIFLCFSTKILLLLLLLVFLYAAADACFFPAAAAGRPSWFTDKKRQQSRGESVNKLKHLVQIPIKFLLLLLLLLVRGSVSSPATAEVLSCFEHK